jgi:hypothetical protein
MGASALSNPPSVSKDERVVALAAEAAADGRATGPAAAAAFTPHRIGADLEALRQELITCGRELIGVAPQRASLFVDESLKVLGRLACRLAVIGQVKGGKSSFINALVHRPGLLPTDVNPWTTAVTHLHFARTDAPANVGAEFTFFDPDEWEQLAQGGGYVRELTRRLVPGFEAELLHKHVEAMRRRSEDRLGDKLKNLLGKKHLYPALTPDMLARYVCAGEEGDTPVEPEQRGYYSDIVKSADVYFDANDFGFPTTIIDTPGTNDPFLVRDEITRRALETADVYIVVLTARQALSMADVALLRILRGLHKERIAVFLNRIDELDDIARDSRAIIEQVRTGLRREFPGVDIPVVAGSAAWANAAMAGAEPAIARTFGAKARSYSIHLAQQKAGRPLSQALGSGGSLEEARSALLVCSGLPALADCLSGLVVRSHAGHVLGQVSASFAQLVDLTRSAARHQIQVLERDLDADRARHTRGEEELRLLELEADEHDRLTATLHSLLIDLQSRTEQLIADQCDTLLEVLRDAVHGFSESECDGFIQAAGARSRPRVWTCQTASLRQVLEEGFLKTFREAETRIVGLERSIVPKLLELLASYNPSMAGGATSAPGLVRHELPSLSALGQMVALDLGEPWWKRWWSGPSSVDQQVALLDQLIRQEFYPVVDALVAAARSRLKLNQVALLQQSTTVILSLVEVLQELSRARVARMRELMAERDAFREGKVEHERAGRIGELRRKIEVSDQLGGRIETIQRVWNEKLR